MVSRIVLQAVVVIDVFVEMGLNLRMIISFYLVVNDKVVASVMDGNKGLGITPKNFEVVVLLNLTVVWVLGLPTPYGALEEEAGRY